MAKHTVNGRRDSYIHPTLFSVPELAPRLHAFLTYQLSIISMSRADWETVRPPHGKPTLLDLGRTPLQRLDGPGVHSVVEEVTGPEYRVSIFRPDANDAALGYPINTDRYVPWEEFPSFLDLSQIVNRASTSLDAHVAQYVYERVFLLKQRPDAEHWLPDCPPLVKLLVRNDE